MLNSAALFWFLEKLTPAERAEIPRRVHEGAGDARAAGDRQTGPTAKGQGMKVKGKRATK